MNYLIGDIETSVNNIGSNAVGTFKASPFCKDNRIVSYGWLSRDDPNVHIDYMVEPTWDLSKIDTMVFHHAQFDIAYLLLHHKEEMTEWIKNGGKIYCTMIAEYLLTNLQHKFPSLDDTCVKYGGIVKVDKMKEYWKVGVRTEDIPREDHDPYLTGDVENTHKIYLGQIKKAKELGMENLFTCHFEALLGLIAMNINGMKFDVKFARQEAYRLSVELLKLKEYTSNFMASYFVTEFETNPSSSQQLSCMLFGGQYKYKKRGKILNPDGSIACKQERRQIPKLDEDGSPTYYKSGKRKGEPILCWEKYDGEPKEKWYEYLGKCKGLDFIPNPQWRLKDKRYYSVGEENILSLVKKAKTEEAKKFITSIVNMSTIEKDLSTYFIGYSKLVWPDSGIIHPNFNTTSTDTGRLSSSKPNLQNLSAKKGSKIKQCFVSRWGDDGTILEADLSQIEVVYQAFITQDIQLMKDISDGIDLHCMRLAFKLREDYDSVYEKCHNESNPEYPVYHKLRTAIKVLTFRKSYGAGATSLAQAADCTLQEAKDFISAEAIMYPRIPLVQEQWIQEAEDNKYITSNKTFKGEPAKLSYLVSPTGKRYALQEEDIPKNLQMFSAYRDAARKNPDLLYNQFKNWGKPKKTGFKPTKIKNYPIQGGSGELLYLIIGKLNRILINSKELAGKCLLINTVHDSIVLDCHNSVLDKAVKLLYNVMNNTPTLFKECFGIEFNVPIRGEVEGGVNWGLKEKIEC